MHPLFRLPDRVATLGTLTLLLLAGLFAAFWPQADFSEAERRYLAAVPAAPSLTAWHTDQEVEAYLADRVPLRRLLVGINAGAQTLAGQRTQLETWPVAGVVIEPPVTVRTQTLSRRLAQWRKVAEAANAPLLLLVPPTHGSLLRGQMNALLSARYAAEDEAMALLAAEEGWIALPEAFTAHPETVYYATDHHWTAYGAYLACQEVLSRMGLPATAWADYVEEDFPGFSGTTVSRSGLLTGLRDTLVTLRPAEEVTLTVSAEELVTQRLIYPERASTWDGYAVYLDGNHGLLTVENPAAEGGTLLVFRDSFASCLLPMLAARYQRIVAVDARYYAGSFNEAIAEAGEVEAVLCVYSLDSIANDTAIARKLSGF